MEKGSLFPNFQLLIDFKTLGEDGFKRLDAIQRDPKYAGLFTHYANGSVTPGPVTVVISGDKPYAYLQGMTDRYAFLDGAIDGDTGKDKALVPLLSDDWTNQFSWDGSGDMPADQRTKLEGIVHDAHAAGQKVRFWNTSDDPTRQRAAIWTVLRDTGVDYLNSNDLAGLQEFLTHP